MAPESLDFLAAFLHYPAQWIFSSLSIVHCAAIKQNRQKKEEQANEQKTRTVKARKNIKGDAKNPEIAGFFAAHDE